MLFDFQDFGLPLPAVLATSDAFMSPRPFACTRFVGLKYHGDANIASPEEQLPKRVLAVLN